MALICDTGALYAAIDRRDRSHSSCAELLSAADILQVPAPVIPELDWLTASRSLEGSFAQFLYDVAEGVRVRVVDLTRTDYARTCELMLQYADLPLGFVDAAVVTVAERMGQRTVASLNRRHLGVVSTKLGLLCLAPEE